MDKARPKPTIAATAKAGARPRARATPVIVRIAPAQLKRLEQWIAEQGGDFGRSEAVRRLVDLGLAAAAARPSLAQQIAKQEQKLARQIPVKVGPERGHALMRKGLAEVEHRKLVAQQARGRKSAGDPDALRRPAQATGAMGGAAVDGALTRRAIAAKVARPTPASGKKTP